jgi:hypothetical protein
LQGNRNEELDYPYVAYYGIYYFHRKEILPANYYKMIEEIEKTEQSIVLLLFLQLFQEYRFIFIVQSRKNIFSILEMR